MYIISKNRNYFLYFIYIHILCACPNSTCLNSSLIVSEESELRLKMPTAKYGAGFSPVCVSRHWLHRVLSRSVKGISFELVGLMLTAWCKRER